MDTRANVAAARKLSVVLRLVMRFCTSFLSSGEPHRLVVLAFR
jgi:hypothetical protein